MRVCVHECVVNVIVKRPVLPPSVVDGHSRNPLYYYYYYTVVHHRAFQGDVTHHGAVQGDVTHHGAFQGDVTQSCTPWSFPR